jgi:hypothetical protein
VKSPISMKNGRFNTSKCRGKLHKMGVLFQNSPQMPGSSSKVPKKIRIKKFKIGTPDNRGARAAAGGRSLVTSRARRGPPLLYSYPPFSSLMPLFFSSCPYFFPHVVNSFSLVPAHARPAHTSPENFKHP